MPRVLAIGDIHGCSRAFDLLLADVNPHGDDTIVTLGDYVDRGPDSKGVLDRMLDLQRAGRLVALRGNHEQMLVASRQLSDERELWSECGGQATLNSYGDATRTGTLDDIPERHWEFMESTCVDSYECPTHFFVHAGALPHLSLVEQPGHILFWESFQDRGPHESGKILVCGHTQQRSGVPLNIGYAICLDTWAYGDGWLSCLDVGSGRLWQTNQKGGRRSFHIDEFLVDGRLDL